MRREGFLHVVVRGPGVVEVRQQPVIVLKMGFVSEADFFESDLLNRLTDLLDISSSQLRVANVVREDSGTAPRRRRRRETAKTEVEVGGGRRAPGQSEVARRVAGAVARWSKVGECAVKFNS